MGLGGGNSWGGGFKVIVWGAIHKGEEGAIFMEGVVNLFRHYGLDSLPELPSLSHQ